MLSPPKLQRHCKKCGGKEQYSSSGLFRMNANKKNLDVWLIYRCDRCKNTWNMEIFSRIPSKALPEALLRGFQSNDERLALAYASDMALLKKHALEILPPALEIAGELPLPGEPALLTLDASAFPGLRLGAILKQKLQISAKSLDALLESGCIRSLDGLDIRRHRVAAQTLRLQLHLPQ